MISAPQPNVVTRELPPHLTTWQLPPGWRWGAEGLQTEHRHYQEIVDALGRSLSLVSVPNAAHAPWLEAEARFLAHRSSHPSIPTTYHYWMINPEVRRGPGYLRRWIAGETVASHTRRLGAEDVPYTLQLLRAAGSALAYLHDGGSVHGAISSETAWITPTSRIWLLGWQWAVSRDHIPDGLAPDPRWTPPPPEWTTGQWTPTPASDQWQLAAMCFATLTGEQPPPRDVPPVRWVIPECPATVAAIIDRALSPDPAKRYGSLAAMLRALDRASPTRPTTLIGDTGEHELPTDDDETRLRWAVGDDYDVVASLGSGTFGTVWRVRDLTLGREVALKMLHSQIGSDAVAVSRFRREARLAAQLAHPAIVPIYDWDQRGDVSWYTMELADGGSVADLVSQSGPRPLADIVTQVGSVLDGLSAAHSNGIIHRDLKPENILIDRYGLWRISDFGIANVAGEDRATASGTPAFAAPEQILGETQGPPVDCFAMAAIVAFVLTGRPPFGSKDSTAILARALGGQADLEGIPEGVTDWLRRGLAPDPTARFPEASVMCEAWRAVTRIAVRRERAASWWSRLLGERPAEV